MNIISGRGRKLVVQHVTHYHSVQTAGTRICSAQYFTSTTLKGGVSAVSLVQWHRTVHMSRLYIAVGQEHIDPITSAIFITEYDYRFPIGYFWPDVFQELHRFVVWSYPHKLLRHENVM